MKFNVQNIMEQIQKVQGELEKVKAEISLKTVTADSGGGMVVATMNGDSMLQNIKISPELMNMNDIEMLEDLVVAAVNKAVTAAKVMSDDEMKRIAGFLPNLPGMNLNL